MTVTSLPALHCSKNCFQKLLVTPHRTCIQNEHQIRNLNTKNYIINIKSHGNERLTRVEYECFRHSSHKPEKDEAQEFDEVCSIGPSAHKLQEELIKESEAIDGEWTASVTPVESMILPALPSEKKLNTKELSMKATAAQITAGVKELILLDPP